MEESVAVKKLLPKPTQVVDDVKHLTTDSYLKVIEKYLEDVTGYPGVCFVGQFGSMGSPGVSDIDLLVITRDEHFKAVRQRSKDIVQELPNGSYLFWHPVAVLPLSLVEAGNIIHFFDNIQVLWGDEAIVGQLMKPAFHLSVINTIVWNSYFWSVVFRLGYGRRGLRFLLLVLGNIVKSISADYELLGRYGKGRSFVKWGKEARSMVMAAASDNRPTLVVHYLEEALLRWLEADWELQKWWNHRVQRSSKDYSMLLSVKERIVLHFREDRDSAGSERGSPNSLLEKLLCQFNLATAFALPTFYLDVFISIKSAFGPELNQRSFGKIAEIVMLDSQTTIWREAINTYKKAVESVRDFSARIGDHELDMFGELFASPFNL